jgi:S1-C subfamily serine protease
MSEVLQNLSHALADTVERASAGVLRVEGRRRLPATGIAWSQDGHLVTAHHVVERDEDLRVGLPDGEKVSATLIGRDPSTDLALLKTGASLTPAKWSNLDEVKVGHLALALGRPGGRLQATLGIVSALGDAWRTPGGGTVDRYLQTDVVMYPGFSGGPLVDVQGQVLGMNTSALRGVSLAVPTESIQRVLQALQEHGRIRRGYLGVGAQAARLPEALAKELDQETGLLLISVESDSPAQAGGLAMGDTIISLDDNPTPHLDALLSLLSGERVGQQVDLRILRGGSLESHTLTIGERK